MNVFTPARKSSVSSTMTTSSTSSTSSSRSVRSFFKVFSSRQPLSSQDTMVTFTSSRSVGIAEELDDDNMAWGKSRRR